MGEGMSDDQAVERVARPAEPARVFGDVADLPFGARHAMVLSEDSHQIVGGTRNAPIA